MFNKGDVMDDINSVFDRLSANNSDWLETDFDSNAYSVLGYYPDWSTMTKH